MLFVGRLSAHAEKLPPLLSAVCYLLSRILDHLSPADLFLSPRPTQASAGDSGGGAAKRKRTEGAR